MEQSDLSPILENAGISAWRYYPAVSSTNDLAMDWALQGAPDGALVIADVQTAGRGRDGRPWVTRAADALAVSLVLKPSADEAGFVTRFTTLAALGLVRALAGLGLEGQIKWPNDVLLKGRKVAGILVEAAWQEDRLMGMVVGIGVNVSPGAVPPDADLRYPATSVEDALGWPVDRWQFLAEIIQSLNQVRANLSGDEFIRAWNAHLALRGQWVSFTQPGYDPAQMKIIGVSPDGRLILEDESGKRIAAVQGEIGMPKG